MQALHGNDAGCKMCLRSHTHGVSAEPMGIQTFQCKFLCKTDSSCWQWIDASTTPKIWSIWIYAFLAFFPLDFALGSADAELLRLVDLVKSRSAFAASFKSVTAWVTSSSLASNSRDMAGICQYFFGRETIFRFMAVRLLWGCSQKKKMTKPGILHCQIPSAQAFSRSNAWSTTFRSSIKTKLFWTSSFTAFLMLSLLGSFIC